VNKLLFKDLYNLLNTVLNSEYFTDTLFLHYLTGFSSPEVFNGISCSTFANSVLNYHANLRTIFGDQYLKMRDLNQQLNLENLIHEISDKSSYVNIVKNSLRNKTDDILKLYKKYNIPILFKTDIEHLLLNLFTECITEKSSTLFKLNKNQRFKESTIKSTLGRGEDSKKLRDKLDQYHKVIISGQLGSGKSHFIKYCLGIWNLHDYCYINYNTNINNTLHKITFRDCNNNKYFDLILNKDLSDPRYSSALLVIDHMYFSDNICSELEQLAQLPLNIIVITLTNINVTSFYTFELPALSDDTLQDIFESYTNISLSNKRIKNKLFGITQRNICMISLIMRLCKKFSPKESSGILTQILSRLSILNDHLLPSLNHEKNTTDTTSYLSYTPKLDRKFKISNNANTLNLIGNIKNIYYEIHDHLDDNAKEHMKYLCCFGWEPVPCEFFQTIFPSYSEDTIQKLHEMGLLELINETIQLSPLIAHAVVAVEKPDPPDYNFLVDNMIHFLTEYENTLSVPYLSNTLSVFVHTLYNNVRAKNYTNEKEKSEASKKRKLLLHMVHEYYNQIGDYILAKDILELINSVNLRTEYNPIDIQLFSISNELQMTTTVKSLLPNQLDEICCAISDNYNPDNAFNATNTIINALDLITGLYCTNFFLLLYRQNDLLQYQNTLTRVMNTILGKINLISNDNVISIDSEKMEYYKLCNHFMNNPFPESDKIIDYIQKIKQWKNINYRIRGTAFILIMQNFYIYYLTYTIQKTPDTLRSLFESKIMPELHYMSDLIKECKLIPVQTFKLCYYSYISAEIIQHYFLALHYIDRKSIPDPSIIDEIRILISLTIISKEDLDTAMFYLDQISILPEHEPNN